MNATFFVEEELKATRISGCVSCVFLAYNAAPPQNFRSSSEFDIYSIARPHTEILVLDDKQPERRLKRLL
jgi:hypothetical protein